MKNREIKSKYLIIACIAAAVVVFAFAFIMDNVFNGLFFEWFASRFMDTSYPLGVDTNALKVLIICCVVIIVLIGVLTAYFVSRWMDRKNKAELAEVFSEYMKSGTDENIQLPENYERLAEEIIAFKSEMDRKTWLVKEETSRKNDLITYLAHDLKTPMTSIIGYLSILSEAADMPEDQREKYTDIALKKSYRLDDLINEFFDITRYNLSSIELDKRDTDISYMIVQIADEFYPMLKNGQRIEIEEAEKIKAVVDPDKIARVFNNIIKNAVLYGYENSIIKVDMAYEDDNLKVEISNHGDTIPEEKLRRIFEKFYRLDESRSSTAGAGLGLAIAKEIVTAHGGQISAESSDGITKFTVILPKA